VDFGGGLERIAAAVYNDPDVFKIDVFFESRIVIEETISNHYENEQQSIRIILDHTRAAMFLIEAGVTPSNKGQGYILRRLIRRSVAHARKLNIELEKLFSGELIHFFKSAYPQEMFTKNDIAKVFIEEVAKFAVTLEKGLREFEKLDQIDGKTAFDLFQTYGFPLELTLELAQEKGQEVDVEEFKKAFEIHQEKSRSASAGTFKGGLADQSEKTTALHTATHLLHSALRTVLGEHVQQKGSNITAERLRFDFTHDAKLTDDQIAEIQNLVNEQIDKNVSVTKKMMTLEEAKSSGALAFFGEKYGDNVSVYTIGDFSKEVCGGPHVTKLSELQGHVTITKQDSVSSGVRRLYAEIH
jgi:alanyl-tRNA synthetase